MRHCVTKRHDKVPVDILRRFVLAFPMSETSLSTPSEISTVCHREFGDPTTVALLENWPATEPAPGEVVVSMAYAPINPADLNSLEGTYGVKPKLPAPCGNEGAGRIAKLGAGVESLKIGDPVLLPSGSGTWRSAVVVSAERVVPLPADTQLRDACMWTVNPPTALRMLTDFVSLAPGDWIVQNAANSAVGRCVIQIAKARGWKTLNVVRRTELVEELKALGADVVVTDTVDLRKETANLTGGAAPRLGLNAVGGDGALNVANALGTGGTMVTYGAMSKQPLKLPTGLLIFKDLRFVGFWMSRWYKKATPAAVRAMVAELTDLAAAGRLVMPVEAEYPLARIHEAIAHARRGERAGKILLSMNP
jgi:NADPH:quinone reductase-like Zn-dependent oxidoreductase